MFLVRSGCGWLRLEVARNLMQPAKCSRLVQVAVAPAPVGGNATATKRNLAQPIEVTA